MTEGSDRTRRLRARALLDEWFPVVALVALLLLLGGGYATYTAYASPGTSVEQRQVASWQGNGTYTTTARVTEPNPVFPVGTRLSDRAAYFRSVSPRLNGTFAFAYRASDGGSLDVTVEQALVIRSVEETESGTTEYWRVEEPLPGADASGVPPGTPVEATFSTNVSRIADRAVAVSQQLGGSPGTTGTLVRTEVTVAGEVNGRPVERTATYRLPISIDGTVYAPGSVGGEAVSGTTTERVTVERSYGPLWRFGGPAAAGIGLLALAALGLGRARGTFALDPDERDLLAHRTTRAEFEDWITTGRVPAEATTRPQVEVESLEGLVDVAVDTDERVFELPDRGAYYVLAGDYVCVYRPPAAVRSRTAPSDGDGELPPNSSTDRGDGASPEAPTDAPEDGWIDPDVGAPEEAGDADGAGNADDRSP